MSIDRPHTQFTEDLIEELFNNKFRGLSLESGKDVDETKPDIKVQYLESTLMKVCKLSMKVNMWLEDIKLFKQALQKVQSSYKIEPRGAEDEFAAIELTELMSMLVGAKNELTQQCGQCSRTIQDATKFAKDLLDSSQLAMEDLSRKVHEVVNGAQIDPMNAQKLEYLLQCARSELSADETKLNQVAGVK